jgi:hypothetical protein
MHCLHLVNCTTPFFAFLCVKNNKFFVKALLLIIIAVIVSQCRDKVVDANNKLNFCFHLFRALQLVTIAFHLSIQSDYEWTTTMITLLSYTISYDDYDCCCCCRSNNNVWHIRNLIKKVFRLSAKGKIRWNMKLRFIIELTHIVFLSFSRIWNNGKNSWFQMNFLQF